ncbi:MAG: alpha-amylase family glycosyl hydrolase [Gemmatimonadales bacterium]
MGEAGLACLPTSNHDFPRLACGARDGQQLHPAMVFMLTWPSVPAIYYGHEIGMRHMPGLPVKEGQRARREVTTGGSGLPARVDRYQDVMLAVAAFEDHGHAASRAAAIQRSGRAGTRPRTPSGPRMAHPSQLTLLPGERYCGTPSRCPPDPESVGSVIVDVGTCRWAGCGESGSRGSGVHSARSGRTRRAGRAVAREVSRDYSPAIERLPLNGDVGLESAVPLPPPFPFQERS